MVIELSTTVTNYTKKEFKKYISNSYGEMSQQLLEGKNVNTEKLLKYVFLKLNLALLKKFNLAHHIK